MDIKVSLVMILISMTFCNCSKMTMQQMIKFDVFRLHNSIFSSYLTKVSIGTPPKIFDVVIDTGSDVTWIDCSNTGPNFFNLADSSTASIVHCSDQFPCSVNVLYKDGSQSSMYMVSDEFHFSTLLPNLSTSQLSSRIIFGCSTMNTLDPQIDGILGLGRAEVSLISQLFTQNIAPNVASHCLSSEGDGYLLLGKLLEDGFSYSPLIPSLEKYQVPLESISVNNMQIRVKNYEGKDGTIFDSGTTLTLLVAGVYDYILEAVSVAVNTSVLPGYPGSCYDSSLLSSDSFPHITIHFANGALMLLLPKDYLIYDSNMWCLGFQRDESITILGDLVLRDKVIVYDQPRERIGWLTHNCSHSLNFSWTYEYTSGRRVEQSWRLSYVLILFTCFILF